MKKFVTILLSCLVIGSLGLYGSENIYYRPGIETSGWHPDTLGDGYQSRFVSLGKDFDGPARCTVIRKLTSSGSHKAILYIHGFNDYFFQKEFGNRFVDSCYNFYAVDLRRYGRSLQPWQYPFNIRDMRAYFQEIDSAMNIIRRDGNVDITLYGHSTGGLTAALFASDRGARCGLTRMILDSPFLEWNFNTFYRKVLIPLVGLLGRIDKDFKIDQGHCDAYAYSLLKEYYGEWEYDTNWKMIYSPPVTAAWVNAISQAQKRLDRNASHVVIPVFTMTSGRKVESCGWEPEVMSGDAVLDPDEIGKRAARLGKRCKVQRVDNALHNIILSSYIPREEGYRYIFDFMGGRL